MATAAQIQAEAASMPQTQASLDALLLKYSPAEMAAAFPQFGNVADFNNATREAAQRVEQQQQAANREAVRADMAAQGEEVRIANPGGSVTTSNAPRPQMSAIPQSEIDVARARLTPEQQQFIDWQQSQINPMTGRPVSEDFSRQGVNPYLNPSQAQAQIDRAANREALFAQSGVEPGNLRPWTNVPPAAAAPVAAPAGGLLGGATPAPSASQAGGLLGAPSGPAQTNAAPSRIQAIQDWYNANVGRGTQQDLNRWLATSGYTAREINTALPQWGLNDLQNAMRTAISEVAQQTPFAPVAAQPMQPLVQPYTSIASQLPGGADARAQEIRNWYAANEGRGTQADLDRFLASGYSAQEINRALPQWGVNDLERVISAARQQYPEAAFQRQLSQYQAIAPGAQFTGSVAPSGLIMDQMQPTTNPYADTLANISLGGYNPGLYNVLLDETIDPVTGAIIPDGGGGGDSGGGGSAGSDGSGDGGGMGNSGEGGGAPGEGGWAKGGLIDKLTGPDPAGPDEGYGKLQVGEYVIKKSSVNKYGKGLLDMINEGKIPAKKIKSLLD
jgi:hypothetical protein